METLFRVAHSPNFNAGVQALMLIQKLCTISPTVTDRFYRTLYESLLDSRLAQSSKHTMYLNLLLRAMKADHDSKRVKAFAKRMLQITTLHQVPFACGILYVLSQIKETLPAIGTLIEQPEDHHSLITYPHGTNIGQEYDGRNRHPESSNAHLSGLWEIVSHCLSLLIQSFC